MKKVSFWVLAALMCIYFAGCGDTGKMNYTSITAEEAKNIMDNESGYVILDVRTEDEFGGGHVPGAIVIPYDDIENQAAEKLPDKDGLILVYCRSGRRSKIGAETLAGMGYSNVKEFGGITDWEYEIEK